MAHMQDYLIQLWAARLMKVARNTNLGADAAEARPQYTAKAAVLSHGR